jgi:hypothetical protein
MGSMGARGGMGRPGGRAPAKKPQNVGKSIGIIIGGIILGLALGSGAGALYYKLSTPKAPAAPAAGTPQSFMSGDPAAIPLVYWITVSAPSA